MQIALVVVLGAGLVRGVFSEPTLTFAVDEAAKRLNEELGLNLVIAHIEADPETARVIAGPVVLTGTDGAVLFSAREVRARVAPLKLFERRLRLEELEVLEPRVRLRVVDGAIAGVRTGSESDSAPLFRVDVADFQLHDGMVDIDVLNTDADATGATDPSAPPALRRVLRARSEGIEARLRDRGRREHRLKLSVARAKLWVPERLIALAAAPQAASTKTSAPDEGQQQVVPIDAFTGKLVVVGDGLLAPERITVSEVKLASRGVEASVAGTVALTDTGLLPGFTADVHARAELADALAPLALPVDVRGTVSVTARVEAAPGGLDLEARGQVEGSGLHVGRTDLGALRARARADRSGLELDDLSWDWADTSLHGRAAVRFTDALAVEARAEATGFSMYRMLEQLGVRGSWAEAHLDAAAAISGTLRPLQLNGRGDGVFTDVAVGSSDVRRVPPEQTKLRTALPVHARDVDIEVDAEGMRFQGTVDDGLTHARGDVFIGLTSARGVEIVAEGDPVDFASIGNRIGSLGYVGRGRATFQMGKESVSGSRKPVLTAGIALEGFALQQYAFGDATGKLHFHNGVLRFDELVALRGADTEYGGTVVLDFNDTAGGPAPQLAVDLVFERAAAQSLRDIVPQDATGPVLAFLRDDLVLEGPLRGHITASGPIGDGTMDRMEGSGALELLDGARLLEQHLAGVAALRMDAQVFRLEMPQVRLGAPGSAQGAAQLALSVDRSTAQLEGALTLEGVPLAQVDALKDSARPFTGRLDVQARIQGQARNPVLAGRASLHEAAYGAVPIGAADVDLRHTDRRLTLNGAVLTGRGDAAIEVETRRPFAYSAALQLTRGPLDQLLPVDALPGSVKVSVAGSVEARGALSSFRESRGTLTLKTLDVDAQGVTLVARGDVAAHFHGTRLAIDLLDLTSATGDLVHVRGLLSDDLLDVQVSSNGTLAFLAQASPKVRDAGGRFTLDLALTGTLDRTVMSGQAFVSAGQLHIDGPLPPLQDLEGHLVFRGNSVILERAAARAGSARLSARGALTLDGLTPQLYDLEARYTRLPLTLPGPIETLSSGQLALKGDVNLPTLSGEVRVHSARYVEDISWERLLPDLRRRGGALRSYNADDEDLRLDVHLMAERGGVVIENNVLDVEAKGDLFLTGTEERPGLKGSLQLVRGNATFRGNRYRLPRGTAEFIETYRILPTLDVEAETRVQDYDITAHVTGAAEAPNIDLRARPDLSDVDIVSLLTFGFTQFDMKDAGGSAGAAGLEVVSAYTGLDQELRRVLPEAVRRSSAVSLDELRLTSQFSMRAGASIPAVALGMAMNPGIWGLDGSRLRLQSTIVDTTGNGTEQRVEWEKRFDNNVRLRMMWSSEDDGTCPACTNQWGDLGGDLWYRWEF